MAAKYFIVVNFTGGAKAKLIALQKRVSPNSHIYIIKPHVTLQGPLFKAPSKEYLKYLETFCKGSVLIEGVDILQRANNKGEAIVLLVKHEGFSKATYKQDYLNPILHITIAKTDNILEANKIKQDLEKEDFSLLTYSYVLAVHKKQIADCQK